MAGIDAEYDLLHYRSGVYHTISPHLLPDPALLPLNHPGREELLVASSWQYTNHAVLLVGWGQVCVCVCVCVYLYRKISENI
jgi:hypothetical protein